MAKTNPFDFLNAITFGKQNMMHDPEISEKDYVPFVINRSLSYHVDSLFYANDMNMYKDLDNALQFTYLLHSLRPRKRFAKWAKPIDSENLELVQKAFGYNKRRAAEVLDLLSEDDITQLKQEQEVGGVQGDNGVRQSRG